MKPLALCLQQGSVYDSRASVFTLYMWLTKLQ